MSEKLSYDRILAEKMAQLPLPDESMAWEDMRRRLEEKKRRRLLFWWRPGCGLLLLGLIAMLTAVVFIYDPLNWMNKSKKSESSQIELKKNAPAIPESSQKENSGSTSQTKIESPFNDGKTVPDSFNDYSDIETENGESIKKPIGNVPQVRNDPQRTGPGSKPNLKENNGELKETDSRRNGQVDIDVKKENPTDENRLLNENLKQKLDSTSTPEDEKQTENEIDPIEKKEPADSLATSKPSEEEKSDDKKRNNYYWSAMVELSQQLPIDGQTLTPFNSLGRKGNITDYLPAVYARFNKEGKWFIQGGFRYGAPQQTKEPVYISQKVADTAFETTTTFKLKKSFYHQVPLSFHYYILPNLSIGTGVIWNRFSSAVAEREVHKVNLNTLEDSLLFRGVVRDRGDSLFVKSFFQAQFQLDYKWRRFEIGARYSFGLQPYLEFILPGEPLRQEKNSSFQILLRYQLWKQKKKAKDSNP